MLGASEVSRVLTLHLSISGLLAGIDPGYVHHYNGRRATGELVEMPMSFH